MTGDRIQERLEYLRGEIRAERISYGEIAELQGLADQIDPSDVELLEWAGVPEFPEEPPAIACDLARWAYAKGPDSLHWHTLWDGTEVLWLGNRKLCIADEVEDDSDRTQWGWVWSTYERDSFTDDWEIMTTMAEPVDRESWVRKALWEWANDA